MTIRYELFGVAGPQFTYRDPNFDVTRRGDEINVSQAEFRQVVSVTLEALADLRTITFSLVLPTIVLAPNHNTSVVHTLAVLAVDHTTRPAPVGQLQRYRSLHLSGEAIHVQAA